MSNCFKGEFKVATQSLLGKADLKKLKEKLLEEFDGRLTKRELDKVLSNKKDINLLKCSNGTTLYVPEGGAPAFFDDGFGAIYPTLFTLWRLPHMMPELVTHGPVSKFLLPKERSAGADMMMPGVIVPDEGLGEWELGEKRLIRVQGNPMPLAVGRMLVSSADVSKDGMKGKGMAVLHVYRDALWVHGGRKVPNEGFGADEVTAHEGGALERQSNQMEDDDDDEGGGNDADGGGANGGADEAPEEEMEPDDLLEYCFFAALRISCTDDQFPVTADKFYSHHMQPARPAKQPPLDAKRSSYKQIGKFIKQMHKLKIVSVRDVKGNITLLSADRSHPALTEFELRSGSNAGAAVSAAADVAPHKDGQSLEVPLRTRPPVVVPMWQPNSYTKPLVEAVGLDRNGYFSKEEVEKMLDKYCNEAFESHEAPSATGTGERPTAGRAAVLGWLMDAGIDADAAADAADALVDDGFDSMRALRAGVAYGALDKAELTDMYKVPAAHAALCRCCLESDVPPFLVRAGIPPETAASYYEAFEKEGFDLVKILKIAEMTIGDFEGFGVSPKDAAKLSEALVAVPMPEPTTPDSDAEEAEAEAPPKPPTKREKAELDPEAVPIDDLLLNALIKVAGGVKKGTTYPTHLPLDELRERLFERMSPFHKVTVEGEAPCVRKVNSPPPLPPPLYPPPLPPPYKARIPLILGAVAATLFATGDPLQKIAALRPGGGRNIPQWEDEGDDDFDDFDED